LDLLSELTVLSRGVEGTDMKALPGDISPNSRLCCLLPPAMVVFVVSSVLMAQPDVRHATAGGEEAGWIVGAEGRIMGMATDGTTEVIRTAPGLRHLRVIPGTQLVVAGRNLGVELFDGRSWQWLRQGGWEGIRYSTNYRAVNILYKAGLHKQVDVIRLSPEVSRVATLSLPPDGYGWEKAYTLGYGVHRGVNNHHVVLPTSRDGFAYRSCYYVYDNETPPVEVWVTHLGRYLPVEFIALDDESDAAYATVTIRPPPEGEAQPLEGAIVRLDMARLREGIMEQGKDGQGRRLVLTVPLTPAITLCSFTKPVQFVEPSPGPRLCYLTGLEKGYDLDLQMVDPAGHEHTVLREDMDDIVEPDRSWNEHWEGNVWDWYIVSVGKLTILGTFRGTVFNPTAGAGVGRMVQADADALRPFGPEVPGLVGHGPFRWSRADPE